jgi:hypothetical protein
VSGRGRIADRIIFKNRRCEIFGLALSEVAQLPEVVLFNAVFPHGQDERAFERLLNRINRTMQAWDSHALIICDEGKEVAYTRLARRMAVFNPIPSRFGFWLDSGEETKNLPLDRIVEDPIFKASTKSYFVQLVDFCAYALLRRERPLASKNRYGLNLVFDKLGPILFRTASRKDPEGIIRP